ncbi:hypothetical protein [Pararobbsia alpina]|uniref:Uncharacterized protein n=1 Tax=Pararobbsia alpina TaxID=621374 RepID=A0A6S7C3Q7_9BURK|nr:hypothetical protein [Pararobbsia alpina]CAB3809375.1 hypothetical protein LMG28138_06098 [Pararobbsia alpina]
MDKLPNVVPAGPQSLQSIPRQMNMTFDSVELQGMSTAQRSTVIRHLANLLAQAAGVALKKERDDDER